jgi:hypothetical protein
LFNAREKASYLGQFHLEPNWAVISHFLSSWKNKFLSNLAPNKNEKIENFVPTCNPGTS